MATRYLTRDSVSGALGQSAGTGALSYSEVTADTTMVVGAGYIVNKAATIAEMTLPATCNVNDRIAVVGKGVTGFSIYSNATATKQKILFGKSTSGESATSKRQLMINDGISDCVTLVCTKQDEVWTVDSNVGMNLISNWFGTGDDGDVVISSDTNLSVPTIDEDMIVKNYRTLTIDAGKTLTVSQRCKGLILYCIGNLTVNGKISMTARGSIGDPSAMSPAVSASGLIVRRIKSGSTESNSTADLFNGCGAAAIASENKQPSIASNGKTYTIPRAGASGGAGRGTYPEAADNGNVGTAGTSGKTGGGGGGACGSAYSGAGLATSGAGAAGTCFSGGTGGGGCCIYYYPEARTAGNGSAYGGQGGSALSRSASASGTGAGNPNGAKVEQDGGSCYSGQDGTGGTLLIFVGGDIIRGSSSEIVSKGSNGGAAPSSATYAAAGGGGSGGGTIIMLYSGTHTAGGTINCDGGAGGIAAGGSWNGNGGAGGAGSVIIDNIDF